MVGFARFLKGFIVVMCSGLVLFGACSAMRAQDDFDNLIAGLQGTICQNTCWIGVQPRVTTFAELQATMNLRNVPLRNISQSSAGADIEGLRTAFGIQEQSGVITRITIRGTFPIDRIRAYFGQPTVVTQLQSDPNIRWLVYLSRGIAFELDIRSSTISAHSVEIVASEYVTRNFGPIEGIAPIQTDCSVFGPPPCILATATPTPVPTAIPTGSVGASLTLARPADGQSISTKLVQGGVVTHSSTTASNKNGFITLPAIPYGAYALWLKHAQHLAASVPVTVSAPTSSVTVPTLRAGDANNSNQVNITDYSILAASYGKSSGTAGYDARADFNGDNTVNVNDYSLLAVNFGQVGAPNPSPDGTFSATLPPPPELVNAALTLDAPRGGARVGRTFTLTVRAGNNASAGAGVVASQIDGLDVHLRFDPALLQVVAVTPGTALDQVIVATFDNATGTIEVAAGELGGSVTGRFSAFTVTFRAIAAGTTTIDADALTALAYQGATISPALASASVTTR